MAELQKIAISRGGNSKSLHTMMMNLLEDNEVETRRIAASQFKGICCLDGGMCRGSSGACHDACVQIAVSSLFLAVNKLKRC